MNTTALLRSVLSFSVKYPNIDLRCDVRKHIPQRYTRKQFTKPSAYTHTDVSIFTTLKSQKLLIALYVRTISVTNSLPLPTRLISIKR
ncbi:Hypothetical predicted protein [Octopus vulgaris]|uniref:Uncharacterized protein n=1 Tax=Octopus vulgaris TaxID=6645 RepID=A0AA36BKA3_OCTVU|nr:Hypothetical predicted protein [Octopus vulgaris]